MTLGLAGECRGSHGPQTPAAVAGLYSSGLVTPHFTYRGYDGADA